MDNFPTNSNDLDIFPKPERVKEIYEILMNDRGTDGRKPVIRRLKKDGLDEMSVAHLVALAEGYLTIFSKIQDEKTVAEKSQKNAKDRMNKEIEKIESSLRTKFTDLPDNLKRSGFYRNGKNPNIIDYMSASNEIAYAKSRLERLIDQKTKPSEKALDIFCRGMKEFYSEKKSRINYQLIADIANLFNLSKNPQNYLTIKERFSRKKL